MELLVYKWLMSQSNEIIIDGELNLNEELNLCILDESQTFTKHLCVGTLSGLFLSGPFIKKFCAFHSLIRSVELMHLILLKT